MAAKKEVKGVVKLVVPAKQANPAPPIGPALGAAGVNIAEFCKQFNDKTADKEPGMPIPVVITAYADRTFDFITKLPPMTYLIKKAAGVTNGSKEPGKTKVAKLKMSQVREIAEKKMADLNARDVEAASQMVIGSARSMGIDVVEG